MVPSSDTKAAPGSPAAMRAGVNKGLRSAFSLSRFDHVLQKNAGQVAAVVSGGFECGVLWRGCQKIFIFYSVTPPFEVTVNGLRQWFTMNYCICWALSCPNSFSRK